MSTIRVFDPAMCCSTGIGGPALAPRLAQFAADLGWLKSQGVSVERFNRSQENGARVSSSNGCCGPADASVAQNKKSGCC